MTEVYLALGSNVGDSTQYITKAIKLLEEVLNDIKQASVYHSKAVGVTNQPDFLNTAVSGQTELEPLAILAKIKAMEQKLGRVEREHWGPREIDIDIIFYGNLVMETPKLTIPHSAFRERDFVLQPLNNLNPSLIDPVTNQTMTQLLAKIETKDQAITGKVD